MRLGLVLSLTICFLQAAAQGHRLDVPSNVKPRRCGQSRPDCVCPRVKKLEIPDEVSKLLISLGELPQSSDPPFRNGTADDITLLGHGSFGCVYGIYANGQFVLAAKTSKLPQSTIFESEITALRKVGDYRGDVTTNAILAGDVVEGAERRFIFMKYVPGTVIENTTGYHAEVTSYDSSPLFQTTAQCQERCMRFVEKVAKKINAIYLHYVDVYGVAHRDVGIHNVVFDQAWDGKNETESYVWLIDWGLAVVLPVEDPYAWEDARLKYGVWMFTKMLERRCNGFSPNTPTLPQRGPNLG